MNTKKVKNIRCIPPKKMESIQDLTSKVLVFLNELSSVDPNLFGVWYEQARSKKEGLEKKVLLTDDFLYTLINKAWDKKFPQLGATFSFWSGKSKEEENSVISFSIGTTIDNSNISNVINIKLPVAEIMQIGLEDTRVNKIKEIYKKIWNTREIAIS